MPNGKFKMKYGDSISPGTFRKDAPVQRFAPKGGTIKSYKDLGIPKYTGSSGALGIIGGAGIKLGLGVIKKSISNLKSFFKQGGAKTQQSLRGSSIPKSVSKLPKPKGVIGKPVIQKPSMTTFKDEYGKVLGKGDLRRRGIRSGDYGGYQVKYKTGLDAQGKQMYSWRSIHPLTHRSPKAWINSKHIIGF